MAGASNGEGDRQGGVSPRYRIVDHVLRLPGVNCACCRASERYHAFKERFLVVAMALTVVEKVASSAYDCLAKPVVDELSGPLHVADDLACKVLDKLEVGFSTTTKKPLEMIAGACNFGKRWCSDGRAYAQEKINACRRLATRVVDAASHPVDTAMAFARNASNTAFQQVAALESTCDEYIAEVAQDWTPENDPRGFLHSRLVEVLWKASVCLSAALNTFHRQASEMAERNIATLTFNRELLADLLLNGADEFR
ncbi:uncharacterized protein LOC119405539 [Rhipicephalus sanguineus]|uniref:uncharacterized protein LOC119405539 n=1 Tax=Rhipicephalus sanguineus TaxID=34632 RepID=UPI0020C30FD9|nr:uncharacterized protein LOC119405539 [Rhipicephalus sanguineus]